MWDDVQLGCLGWYDLDPLRSSHAWSSSEVRRRVLRRIAQVVKRNVGCPSVDDLILEVSRELIAEYGRWAGGWHPAHCSHEGWLIPSCIGDWTSGDAICVAEQVLKHLQVWRSWLEAVSACITLHLPPPEATRSYKGACVEQGVTALCRLAAGQTRWPIPIDHVFSWLLESLGMAPAAARKASGRAVRDYWASGSDGSPCHELGRAVAAQIEPWLA